MLIYNVVLFFVQMRQPWLAVFTKNKAEGFFFDYLSAAFYWRLRPTVWGTFNGLLFTSVCSKFSHTEANFKSIRIRKWRSRLGGIAVDRSPLLRCGLCPKHALFCSHAHSSVKRAQSEHVFLLSTPSTAHNANNVQNGLADGTQR